jgi:hypothetical protein
MKWDLLVNNVNKVLEVFKSLQQNFGNDMDLLHEKISEVDCRIGTIPSGSTAGLEDCLSV